MLLLLLLFVESYYEIFPTISFWFVARNLAKNIDVEYLSNDVLVSRLMIMRMAATIRTVASAVVADTNGTIGPCTIWESRRPS